MTTSTVDKIIEVAETQIRAGGYNACSFREISKQIGIKSASIHYHFPTKVDLGVAVANRYTQRFSDKLAQIAREHPNREARLEHYIALFCYALEVDKKMCLCGQLASETDILPQPVQSEARQFFIANQMWLEQHLCEEAAPERAVMILASLEGALMMSKILSSNTPLHSVQQQLQCLLFC